MFLAGIHYHDYGTDLFHYLINDTSLLTPVMLIKTIVVFNLFH